RAPPSTPLPYTTLFRSAWLLARRYGWENPEGAERPPLGESFRQALPALFAPVLILGGLRSGLFTPTEAAVAGVAYGVLVGLFVRSEEHTSELQSRENLV